MATKAQYDFFKSLYDEEERTYEQLEGRAKVYLGVITAFLAAVLLKAPEVIQSNALLQVPIWGVLVEAILLTIALILILLALRIRAYETVNDAESIIAGFEGEGPSDEEFYEDRIADYAVAASRNLRENNETASFLAFASWLIVTSMVWLMILFIISIWS